MLKYELILKFTLASQRSFLQKANKHITFNKGEYIGHLEPAITDDTTIDDLEPHSANSITLQEMMTEQVQPDIFDPLFIS